MTKANLRTRIAAFILAAILLAGMIPAPARAASIADGSRTATVAPVERHYFLTTTAGTSLGASAYQYSTNDGLTGPAYCIDHGLGYSSHALEITGKYSSSPATAGAFANGYPQHSVSTFLDRYLSDNPTLAGLTEEEYGYATQLAVWATLGQLAIEGTQFSSGRETVRQPTGDAQQMRIFRAVQLILYDAELWDRIYTTGMYIRLEENTLGGNISVPADMTLEYAADNETYGLKREVIGGKSYYTREYIFASATSTYYSDYNIEVWAADAPSGTIFTDTGNNELPRGTFRETATWSLPTTVRDIDINSNGFEYYGVAKMCIPVDTAPNSGEITINCGAYVMQYEIFLANNEIYTEQSYIIADPSKGVVTADAVLNWGGPQTETGDLEIKKISSAGQVLSGATFTLTGTDGTSRTGTTNDSGIIKFTDLDPNVTYTLTEDTPPAGYSVVDPITVTVKAARINYVTVQDSPEAQITVHKQDKQSGYSLQGVVIVFEQINGSFHTEKTTDHAGNITLDAEQLPIGSYRIYEKSAKEGYELSSEVKTVEWDGKRDVTLVFENVRKKTLIIYKSSEGNSRSLPDAVIDVYRDGQFVTSVTTNDNGLAYVPDVATGSYYTAKERIAPSGYALNENEYGVYIDAYDPATTDDPRIVIEDKALPSLRIVKLDRTSLAGIENVTFEVWRDAVSLGRFQTNAGGEIFITGEAGTYLVKEIESVNTHIVCSDPQQIELVSGTGTKELVFFNDKKPGIHLTKLDSADLTKPIANARFKIEAVDGSWGPQEMLTLADGTIDLSLLPATAFVVTELACPGYVVDDAQRIIELKANENMEFVFTDSKLPSLHLFKTDSNGDPVAGASYRLAKIEDGTVYLDRTTSSGGEITWDGLQPGVYSLVETSTLSNLILDPTEYHVELFPGKTSEIVLENRIRPNLYVYKYTADKDDAPVENCVFTVRAADGHSVDEIRTGPDGRAELLNLLPGVYEISEKSVPDAWLMDAPSQLVTLYPDRDHTAYFFDHLKPSIVVEKKSSVTGEYLQGAKFHVEFASGNTTTGELNDLGYYYTGEDGTFTLTHQKDGWFKISEVEPPTGYAVAEEAQEFYLAAGSSKTVTFEDVPLSAIVIWKYDEVYQTPVEATFSLRYLTDTSGTGGTVIGTYKTTKNGSCTITGLKKGTYIIAEESTDSAHVISTAPQTVFLSGEDQDVVQVYFGNTPKGSLLVKKVSTGVDKAPLSGVEFLVTKVDGTLMGDANGKYVTDSAGCFTIENIDPGTNLIVREMRAKSGYLLDETPQSAVIQPGRTAALEFRNQPLGNLTILKRSGADRTTPLEGAEFKITYADGSFVDAEGGRLSSNGVYYTDAQGMITLSGIVGTVIVTETASIDGYTIDESTRTQTVVINPDDTQRLTFYNYPLGSLVIRKYIDGTNYEPLAGVGFRVVDGSGAGVGPDGGTYYTDAAGEIVLTGLEPGMTVTAYEFKTVNGMALDGTPQTIQIQAGAVQHLTFFDQRLGSLVIKKLSGADRKTPLAGVEFLLTYADGRFVDNANGQLSSNGVYFTDSNGEIRITGITGTIVCTEQKSVEGYSIGTDRTQTVVVNEAETQTLYFYNDPVGGVELIKVNEADRTERIPNTSFEIRKADGAFVTTLTTDRNGRTFAALEDGAYYAVETVAGSVAGKRFVVDPAPIYFEVKSGKLTTKTVTNKAFSGILIHKISSLDGKGIYGASFLLYDGNHNPIGQYESDQSGYVYIDGLTEAGRYYLRELSNEGYIVDEQLKTVYVQSGRTTEIEWKNTPITAQIQIVKKSADANPVNGLPAGTLLEGAVFEIYDKAGNVVDTIRSDSRGRAVSKLLPLSRYTIREVTAPAYYAINPTVMNAYLEYAGQIVTFEVLDESVATGVSIKKTGYAEVMPGQPIRYTLTGIANTSTVALESFYWRDTLPGQISLTQLVTGTYNQALAYKVVYRTNLSGESYRTLADNLSTAKNYVLDARPTTLGLAANERVTEIMYVFGTVRAGFAEVEAAYIYGTVNSGLANGSSIVNVADVGGLYDGQWIQAVARWNSSVYVKSSATLPKTGY